MRINLTLLILSVLCAGTASARPLAYVANGDSKNVSVIDVSTNTVVDTVEVGFKPLGVAVTPDGSDVYVTNENSNDLSVIRTSDNKEIRFFPHVNLPQGVAVTPDGRFVYIAGLGGNVAVLKAPSNTLVTLVGVGQGQSGPFGVAVTPDGDFAYVTNEFASTVSVIKTSDNTVVDTIDLFHFGAVDLGPPGVGPFGVAVTPDGDFVYVANADSDNVSIIRTSDNTLVDTVGAGGRESTGVAVTPNGDFVYVANTDSNTVSVIRTSDNTVVDTVDVGMGPFFGVAVTPDGSHVYVTNTDSNTVSVIRTSDNTVVDTVDVGVGPRGVAITPDTDTDGVSNGVDADDDNDGIPDSMETATTQTNSLNSTRNEILLDIKDDAIPNERDLDSDGDGIPDHIEAGGDNDANSDGIVDGFIDADGDGLNDAHDPSQGGTLLPLSDTDGDGVPDFLDRDSDNDGVSDSNETVGCLDADNDGILDNSEDRNNDGLADSVHPETGQPCALLDTDGDGIFDHQDDEDNRRGSSSCAIASSTASDVSFPVYLLIPAFILIARLWRRRTDQNHT